MVLRQKDSDYANPSSLSGRIAVGESKTTITIPIKTDSLNEGNETFNLTLSNLMNAVFTGGKTTLEQQITIVDNEMPTLQFTNQSYSVNETETEIEVSVELTGATGTSVSFTYEIIDVSTKSGDYSVVTSDLSGNDSSRYDGRFINNYYNK